METHWMCHMSLPVGLRFVRFFDEKMFMFEKAIEIDICLLMALDIDYGHGNYYETITWTVSLLILLLS